MAQQGDTLTANGDPQSESELKKPQLLDTDVTPEPDITNGLEANMNGNKSPKKRGRPKACPEVAGNPNGEGLESPPRKRGRPKGTPKKVKQITGTSGEGVENTPKRGRPKGTGKVREKQDTDGTGPRKGRGRPKGSRNKALVVSLESLSGRPKRAHVMPEKFTIALFRKNPGKRGRPKKATRGRPRKYPKEDLSDETPRRGRGRPRKSGSKVRKVPKGKKAQEAPKKRGRPKGSVKKAIIANNSQNSDQNKDEEEKVSDSVSAEDHVANDHQNEAEQKE